MKGKRYNLRPGRREIHLPIQLQLSQDEDFVTQALGSDPTSGQVSLTDLSGTSDSDIDVDKLVHGLDRNLSDSESSPTVTRYARTDSQDHSPVRSTPHKSKKSDQDHINQTILTQLNAISDRLTKIENSASTGEQKSMGKKK